MRIHTVVGVALVSTLAMYHAPAQAVAPTPTPPALRSPLPKPHPPTYRPTRLTLTVSPPNRIQNENKRSTKPVLTAPLVPGMHLHFPRSRVAIGDQTALKTLLTGAGVAQSDRAASPGALKRLTENVHLLMTGGPERYDRVLVTPTLVALVRRSGIIDLISHTDAEAQIRTGQPSTPNKIAIGYGPKGFPMMAEEGPGGTIRLYRQLPSAAKGEVFATHPLTSFALTEDDAFHPWGAPGKTITITIPRRLFDRVLSGELGGTGWAGGRGIGVDVLGEVQIDTPALKAFLEGIPH